MALMLNVRFPLAQRNAQDKLPERDIEISHETVKFWWNGFGALFAAEIRKRRVAPMRSSRWHLYPDEVLVKIGGERHCFRRAVDYEVEVLQSLVTKTIGIIYNPRDIAAARSFAERTANHVGRLAEWGTATA